MIDWPVNDGYQASSYSYVQYITFHAFTVKVQHFKHGWFAFVFVWNITELTKLRSSLKD